MYRHSFKGGITFIYDKNHFQVQAFYPKVSDMRFLNHLSMSS